MNTSPRLQCVQIWAPELAGIGGIQRYSRTLLRGLQEVLPETRITLVAKTESGPKRLRTARFALRLLGRAVWQCPELVILTHLHFAPAAYALRRLTGLRYWIAAHGVEAWERPSERMRRALAGAEKILPVSACTESRMAEATGLPRQRFSILPNAIDGDAFQPGGKPVHLLRRYGLRAEQRVLFTLARLAGQERYKGYDAVLEALVQLKFQLPDVHYILAGRGDDGARIRKRIARLGLEKNVTLTGFLPERELQDHYSLCDLFVMPSVGEGFGIVYLEALACGRPVLAGNRDGAQEPLLGGELGALVDPENVAALATAMLGILTEVPGASSFSDPAYLRRRVLEEFGFERFKQRLGGLLNS